MQSAYYATPAAPNRKRNPISRAEYQARRTEFAPRGQELPQAKLTDLDVIAIRSAVRQRENLLNYITEKLSNKALCKQFGVSANSIDRIISRETWGHIP